VKYLSALLFLVPALAFAQTPALSPAPASMTSGAQPAANPAPAVTLHLPPGLTPPRPAGPPHTCAYPPVHAGPNASGTTRIAFKVAITGTVQDPVIARSSGSTQLDNAALSCVAAWLYAPAIKDGQPVQVGWGATIDWHLMMRGEAPPPVSTASAANTVTPPTRQYRASKCEWWHYGHLPGALVAFYIETDGSVKDPVLLRSSGDAAIDKDALDCITQRSYVPAMQNGRPVEVRLSEVLF
jgi:TonB family protein